jgi:hypothetical protein
MSISPSEMKVKRIDPPAKSSSPTSDSQPTSASTSINHSRSASRSTIRSRPSSRRSSLHSARRTVPKASIVPVPSSRSSPQERRESLIALHRESCRLFQEPSESERATLQRAASATYRTRRESLSLTEKGSSAPSSPNVSSYSDFRFEPEPPTHVAHFLTSRDRSNTMPVGRLSSSSVYVPATVMEWTSPDTRRREYEKIDRASSGVRGFWRRVAPRCFQTRDARIPFFEEGKPEREGSVRRFRMDIPEDEPCSPTNTTMEFKKSDSDGARRRRWAYLRTKSSPSNI